MAPKSVTFRRHDHLVSVLFGDLLSHSYNITFSMFLYLVYTGVGQNTSFYYTADFPAHVDKLHEDDDESFETEYIVS